MKRQPATLPVLISVILFMVIHPGCRPEALEKNGEDSMSISKSQFGRTEEGQEVELYTCSNSRGLTMKVMTYGATLVSLDVPDREGNAENVTLNFPSLDGYLARHPYFGSTVGRFGNRIANARFELDGREYRLAANNGPNHLHGGLKGLDKVLWKAEEVQSGEGVGVRFSYMSPDGEEGYPGNLQVEVLYFLTRSDELRIEFQAATDAATPVNLTNHTYWNLAGARAGKILDHVLTIEADQYIAVDSGLIPTGEIAPVRGTPLDFTEPRRIGERIREMEGDPVGYDHCYVLRNQDGDLALAARVVDPESGREMEVYTTQPGMQFYSGNFLDGAPAAGGFGQWEGFCLETQHYPDSPNQPDFPSTILKPGETYSETTIHRFTTQ